MHMSPQSTILSFFGSGITGSFFLVMIGTVVVPVSLFSVQCRRGVQWLYSSLGGFVKSRFIWHLLKSAVCQVLFKGLAMNKTDKNLYFCKLTFKVDKPPLPLSSLLTVTVFGGQWGDLYKAAWHHYNRYIRLHL